MCTTQCSPYAHAFHMRARRARAPQLGGHAVEIGPKEYGPRRSIGYGWAIARPCGRALLRGWHRSSLAPQLGGELRTVGGVAPDTPVVHSSDPNQAVDNLKPRGASNGGRPGVTTSLTRTSDRSAPTSTVRLDGSSPASSRECR